MRTASTTTHRDAGDFQAVTQVRNDVLEPALKAVLSELEQMAAKPVPGRRADQRQELHGRACTCCGLETQDGVIGQLTNMKALGLPNDYLETYVTRVRSVEPDQILAAAKKYVAPDQAAIVVVGDASKIGDVLKKFGAVTVTKAQ